MTRTRQAIPYAIAMLPGAGFLLYFVLRAADRSGDQPVFTLFDDAMISMAYGRTFAETGDLVWFPGAERVQGITNPLWTLIMSALHAVGIASSDAALAVSIIGIGLILITALMAGLTVAMLQPTSLSNNRLPSPWALLTAATIPFLFPLAYWTLRGMEVGFLALLCVATLSGMAIWQTSRISGRTAPAGLAIIGMAGALGVLTRIDFVLVSISAVAWMMVFAKTPQGRARIALAAGVPVLVTVAAVLVLQFLYYGDWLPNTYHLKMDGVSPLIRLRRGLLSGLKFAPVLVLVGVAAAAIRRHSGSAIVKRFTLVASSVVAIACVYSVWVGGDAWEWSLMANRYESVALPTAATVIFLGGGVLADKPWAIRRKPFVLAASTFVVSGLGVGVTVNPLSFNVGAAAFQVVASALAIAGLILVSFLSTRNSPSTARQWISAGAAAVAVVVAAGAVPGFLWIRDGGIHVAADARMTALSRQVKDVTKPGAIIATAWAGAPGYYAQRPMIDLLGKSDRMIARMTPHDSGDADSFLPGHNKWDIEYSIGVLRPDLILTWQATDDELAKLPEWGFVEKCWADGLAFWVRAASERIEWSQIGDC